MYSAEHVSMHSLTGDDEVERHLEEIFQHTSSSHLALRHRLLRRQSITRSDSRRFSVFMSTEEFNKDPDSDACYGPYSHIRELMDYSYHVHYKKERQWFQNSIIEDILQEDDSYSGASTTPMEPWLIYLVGAQGAGKQHTLFQLRQQNRLPLLSYVLVDPDGIRRRLPEFESYLKKCPESVDALTRKEAGCIAEIVVRAALQAGRNVIWDGALMDGKWFVQFTKFFKKEYTTLKVGLLQVTAPRDVILRRVAHEGRNTERVISEETIDCALDQIPKSVAQLKPFVDFYCIISNVDKLTILTKGLSWDSFRATFAQTSSWHPDHRTLMKCVLDGDEEKKDSLEACVRAGLSRRMSWHRRHFSVLLSTELNHKADKLEFFGPFSHIRETLDYNYHVPYTRERQSLQDAIINDMVGTAVFIDKNGTLCTTPTEPWIVFTAGAMGAGKTHTMNWLVEKGRFPLLAFVTVDPDEIRRQLPEFHLYVERAPELAGELTRKEAGYIAEILTLAGLQAGKNVLVDGSLRDCEWYKGYFERLRRGFKNLRLAIIHVTAPREAIFQRAASRAITTGRVVPKETILEALEQVPKSVEVLAPLVDYFCELYNAPNVPDIELRTEGENWESFRLQWLQTCAWKPSERLQKTLNLEEKLAVGEMKISERLENGMSSS